MRKKSLITVLAALVVFVLGATCVFAVTAETPSWSKDYSSVTIDGTPYDTVRTFMDTAGNGYVNATIDITGVSDSSAVGVANKIQTADTWMMSDGVVYKNGTASTRAALNAAITSVVTADYYDLDNSSVTSVFNSYTQADFEAVFDYDNDAWKAGFAPALTFKCPEYASNYPNNNKVARAMTSFAADNWTCELNTPVGYESGATVDQTFNLATLFTSGTTLPTKDIVGTVPAKTIVVKAEKPTAASVKFYVDAESATALANGAVTSVAYNGAAHKIVTNEVEGMTVKYTVLNYSTGKYEDAASVEATNVDLNGKDVLWKAEVTNSKDTTDKASFTGTLRVVAADAPTFGFDQDGNVQTGTGANDVVYGVSGTTYNALDYVKVSAAATATAPATKDSNKKAVKANEAALKAYFESYYEISAEVKKADPDSIALEIDKKDQTEWTTADKKALIAANEQLCKNFGIGDTVATAPSVAVPWGYEAATMKINYAPTKVVPVVTFQDTPTAVNYKAKKLKKKAASFTVTAVASNGGAITYTLANAPAKIKIDATTGVVTVGKGLKKGTYNVQVKAHTPYTLNGVTYYASETQAIKIKVKK